MNAMTFILWWGAMPLQLLLLWILVRKHAFSPFPWFSSYTLFSIVASFARFLARHHHPTYVRVYWTTDAIYAILGIAVMYEVFRSVLRNLTSARWSRFAFALIVTLGLTLTAARVWLVPPGSGITIWILAGEMAARLLQVIVFVLLVLLATLFGLRWRQHAFGICAGFGLYSTAALFASTKYYEFGTGFRISWGVISIVSYNAAVLIWLWYFSGPLESEPPRADQPPLSAQELGRYKQIVRREPRP
jgi:hypothetical protein